MEKAKRTSGGRNGRLERLLHTITAINTAMVRERSPDRLLAETCRILVKQGHYVMAWAGMTDIASGQVRPAARSGRRADYLDTIEIRCDDTPQGRGPTGTAIRTGKHVLNNDAENNPRFAPWRDAARAVGYRASAAFPLKVGDRVVGAINVYASQKGAFGRTEIKHLLELTGNIGFALHAMELDAARIRAEQERRIAFEALEERVAERTAELARARDEAEQANRAKNEFLSRMSHELRTPLNAILGFAQLLELDTGLDRVALQHARNIESAGNHLLMLISDVLDMARVEAGQVDLAIRDVHTESLLSECARMIEPVARAARVTVMEDWAAVPPVRADPFRLRQVVMNLLSNGIKHNITGSRLTLHAYGEDGTVRIHVSDDGPGVPKVDRHRIFEPFTRLSSAAGVEGSGIGLAISRKLTELMGGGIGVEEAPGGGATFWISLPAGHAEARTPEAATPGAVETVTGKPAEADRRPTGTVLIVEDNPANMMLVKAMLKQFTDCRLLGAETGEKGVELARRHRPDLVLMDINLPGIDGVEALGILRAEPDTAAIPVVALTGNALPDQATQGLRAGFEEYLTKPFRLETLRRTVRRILSTSGDESG